MSQIGEEELPSYKKQIVEEEAGRKAISL